MITNEEWLKNQPTEIFAKYLKCKACSKVFYDEEQDNCFGGDCETAIEIWLKQPRADV